ncbi:Uncharacterised protein [Mycobacteroides abscessus subsp. abscessus]|nr:Uncharacterised protein [Mycobacteroides abscessus subsp. abscessus]
MEQRGYRQLLDRLPERVVPRIRGIKGLHARMELETTNPVIDHQAPSALHSLGPLMRVDRAERNQDVGVLGCLGCNLFA